jgi:hypothetical protein
MMKSIEFESSESAFSYAKEYFEKSKISLKSSYIGIVRHIDSSTEPLVYMLEIICKAGTFLKEESTMMVAAIKHPDLKINLNEKDLVLFGPENFSSQMPTGYVLHKLQTELDVANGSFKVATPIKKFRVYVDDYFHYQSEEDRYLHGEYENLNDAVNACKIIVDQSLAYILENASIEKLSENYFSFGDDPFIEGVHFSSSDYAKFRINEMISASAVASRGVSVWKMEIDHKYGLLLPESEILEGEGKIYLCQTDRNKLCAGWDIQNKRWSVNVDRALLEGLSYSTPKRFEQIVFDDQGDQRGYELKQYLIEYLLLGKKVGEIKDLTLNTASEERIMFSLEAGAWNEILIGNHIAIERGLCTYFEKGSTEERFLPFGLFCENQYLTIEVIRGEYEDYEQYSCYIKDLHGYYE